MFATNLVKYFAFLIRFGDSIGRVYRHIIMFMVADLSLLFMKVLLMRILISPSSLGSVSLKFLLPQ